MLKATLFGLTLSGSLLLFPSTSEAQHRRGRGVEFGIRGSHGGIDWSIRGGRSSWKGYGRGHYRDSCRTAPVYRGHRKHRHVHHYVPHYERVWVDPVYRSVFAGYSSCGDPIYRNVRIRAGYYRQVLRGHRCGCGHRRH